MRVVARPAVYALLCCLCCAPDVWTDVAAAGNTIEWSFLPALPDSAGFGGPFAGVSNDALIVAGGANFPHGPPWQQKPKEWHDRVFMLADPAGSWQQKGRLPRPLGYGVSLTTETGVLCIGGGDAGAHYAGVFELRWEDGAVKTVPYPRLPGARAFFCGALLDGRTVFVAGGRAGPRSSRAQHTFWKLDLAKSEGERGWQELEPWPGPPRILAVGAALDGSFFLFSGAELIPGAQGETTRKMLRDAYRYTPGRGWTRIADLPRAAVAAPTPAVTAGMSHILIHGGDDGANLEKTLEEEHPGFSAGVLAYHTVTDTWRELARMPKDAAGDVWPPVTTVTTTWRGKHVIPTGESRPGLRTPRVLTGALRPQQSGFGPVNYTVLVLYLAALIGMGVYFSRRERSTAQYFLGGRTLPWWAVGLSIFGTQLSAITFMAIPARVYRTDWVYLLGNLCIVLIAPALVWLYLPILRRADITSAYEYLEKRFHLLMRLLGSCAFLLFQLGRMGVVLYLPALALQRVTGIDEVSCICVMGILATLYTVLGGIEAVIWTDVMQVIVLLGGALLSLGLVMSAVEGGFTTVLAEGYAAGKFQMIHWTWDISVAALWVIIAGQPFQHLIPYTSDQTVVQRYLTTPTARDAARSIWTNAVLTVPASLVFFGVGTALWVFYKHHPELLNPAGQTDDIFAWFIVEQLPVGIAGLVIAGLFAAAMSSLDSSMNSMATVVTTDFYRRFRRDADDRQALRLARGSTVAFGVLGTGSALVMAQMNDTSMWDQYLTVMSLLGSGLAGLFAAGMFTRRANAAGMLCGFVASVVVLYCVWAYTTVHFFLYPFAGVLSCVGVGYLASLASPGRSEAEAGLTIYK